MLGLIAYSSYDSCDIKPFGENYNWEWCDPSNMQCNEQVATELCESGIAYLKAVHYHHVLYECKYSYFAEYSCNQTGRSFKKAVLKEKMMRKEIKSTLELISFCSFISVKKNLQFEAKIKIGIINYDYQT